MSRVPFALGLQLADRALEITLDKAAHPRGV
jgi:hypothetical protein